MIEIYLKTTRSYLKFPKRLLSCWWPSDVMNLVSHYLAQWWPPTRFPIICPRNFNRNYNIFIQENTFKSVVCGTTAILPRSRCVNEQQQHVSHASFVYNVTNSRLKTISTGQCVWVRWMIHQWISFDKLFIYHYRKQNLIIHIQGKSSKIDCAIKHGLVRICIFMHYVIVDDQLCCLLELSALWWYKPYYKLWRYS